MIAYIIVGAAVGITIIHPLTLTIVWWELIYSQPDGQRLVTFLGSRIWLGILPRDLSITITYALLGAVVGLAFGLFTRRYVATAKAYQTLREEQITHIPDIISQGENQRIEFKSSVRWDVNENRINRGLEKVIAKTIAGFFNADGGNLVIGVDDEGNALGLDNDYSTLRHGNRDGFERTINDIIRKSLGGDMCPFVHTIFTAIEGKDIALVVIRPAPRAVYMEDGGSSAFFVRSGNSTRQLDVREALSFAQTRWT